MVVDLSGEVHCCLVELAKLAPLVCQVGSTLKRQIAQL